MVFASMYIVLLVFLYVFQVGETARYWNTNQLYSNIDLLPYCLSNEYV